MNRHGYMKIFLCLLLVSFGQEMVWGATNETIVENYTPFLNGQPWPRFPLTAYVNTQSNTWVHPLAPKKSSTIREVHDDDADFITLIIQTPDGKLQKTYVNFVLGPYLSAVYSADLNQDGIPDFIVIKPGSGCGLAAEYCTGVFAFSNGKGYQFTRITTMGLGPHSLILDPKTKGFRLMHTSFCQSPSLDGKTHSFWVHRFYKWEDGLFQRDEDFQTEWIQYLNRPNHRATKLLTPELKTKAWRDSAESERSIEW